jgi:hypothetical protein
MAKNLRQRSAAHPHEPQKTVMTRFEAAVERFSYLRMTVS